VDRGFVKLVELEIVLLTNEDYKYLLIDNLT